MTTRRWMVAVAIVGIVAGGHRLKRRRDYFVHQADYHESAEGAIGLLRFDDPEDEVRPIMDHHAALVRKYRRAARYPWLLVEPDPPEPNRS
jgi:hypothetical protein